VTENAAVRRDYTQRERATARVHHWVLQGSRGD